jgi:hypothetical protein
MELFHGDIHSIQVLHKHHHLISFLLKKNTKNINKKICLMKKLNRTLLDNSLSAHLSYPVKGHNCLESFELDENTDYRQVTAQCF